MGRFSSSSVAIVGAAALLLATPAGAGTAIPLKPDGVAVVADAGRAGGSILFSVPLEWGRDYSVVAFPTGGQADACVKVELLDSAQRPLRGVLTCEDDRRGFEFRPGTTATYFARVSFAPEHQLENYSAAALVGRDCRGGVSTRCTASIGRSAGGRTDFGYEHDYYKVRLQAGRTYTAEMAAPNGDDTIVEFRDARRRVLARSLPVVIGDDGVARARVSLRPRRTGDYWVNAVGGTYTWDYRVSLR